MVNVESVQSELRSNLLVVPFGRPQQDRLDHNVDHAGAVNLHSHNFRIFQIVGSYTFEPAEVKKRELDHTSESIASTGFGTPIG